VIDSREGTLPAGLRTVDEALHRTRFRILPFLGPAFIACVAYIDPGNFATNIAGGSRFGYRLVWVIVAANLLAMLIQVLSAKLGIATGRNLPELCREQFSRRVSLGLWVQAEAIAHGDRPGRVPGRRDRNPPADRTRALPGPPSRRGSPHSRSSRCCASGCACSKR